MQYDHYIHHRQSLRLREYDYSQAGAYFVTICTNRKQHLLGEIINGEAKLNQIGEMVKKWWLILPRKFQNIKIDEYAIMPNHFHGIIIIVGANQCVCPNVIDDVRIGGGHIAFEGGHIAFEGGHIGPPLHRMIQWFKTMTTNEYIRGIKTYSWPCFYGKFWQRNYYERVIRNDTELNKIREYIITNPQKWDTDSENPDVLAL